MTMQVPAACLPCLYPPGCRWGEQQALGEFYETCKINDISNTLIIDTDNQVSNTIKIYTDIDNQNSNTVKICNW